MRAGLAERMPGVLRKLTQPKVALPLWLTVWYAIHFAGFYDFALRNSWALNGEHALLIAIGLLFWWPVLSERPHEAGTLLRLGYLGAAFIGSSFLGLALTFAPDPIYDFYANAPRIWGISAGTDQNLGGILMTAEQSIIFLVAIGYFVLRLSREEDAATLAYESGLRAEHRCGTSHLAAPGTFEHGRACRGEGRH